MILLINKDKLLNSSFTLKNDADDKEKVEMMIEDILNSRNIHDLRDSYPESYEHFMLHFHPYYVELINETDDPNESFDEFIADLLSHQLFEEEGDDYYDDEY